MLKTAWLIIFILSLGTGLSSCFLRVSNSYSEDASLAADPALKLLFSVLRDNSCLRCHAAYGEYLSLQDWTASGLMISGAASDSPLIRHLKGVDSIMPPTGAPVDDAIITELETWINDQG